MNNIRIVDAFAGIGGFHQASKIIAGSKVVAAIEWNDECQETYRNNFPGITMHDDITSISPSDLPDHDLLTGGFPCQPFSKNGKWYNHKKRTVSSDDSRANLFMNLIGILRNCKPRAFVFENVPGIKDSKDHLGDNYVDTILENIKSVGYLVKNSVLSPKMFGIPQDRKRLFFVGFRNDFKSQFDKFDFPSDENSVCSVRDILEKRRVDDKYSIKSVWANRLVTASAKRAASEMFSTKVTGFPKGTPREDVVRAIYAEKKRAGKIPTAPTGKISPVAVIYGDTPSGGPRQQDKVFSAFGVCPTITTFQLTVPVFDILNGWRVLTPRECARLQNFPDSFKLPERDSTAYRQIGNAVCVRVVERILSKLVSTNIFSAR